MFQWDAVDTSPDWGAVKMSSKPSFRVAVLVALKVNGRK